MTRAGTPDVHAGWDALFDGLLAGREALVADMIALTREELPAYSDVAPDALLPGFGLQLDAVLRAARNGHPVSDDELKVLADIGEHRAVQGVPIEDMLRAWRIGIQVVIDHSSRVAAAEAIDADVTLAFVRAVLTWADVTMVTTATAHRRAELELARSDEERRAALVRGLLFGTLPLAEVRDQVRVYGFDPTRTYVAVRARPADLDARRHLEAALGLLDATPHREGLRVTLDGDLAGFLRGRPSLDVAATVGIGPPRPLDELADSFRLATRAFLCAERFGLTGVHSIDDLGLRPCIADDRDVGDALARRFLEPLGAGSSATELVATLRAYFDCSMNVDRTAEQVYVHPNTVRYRLGRFEEMTGVQLRDTRTAFEVWWALEHAATLEEPPSAAP
jgi:hypothetical protein